MPFCCVPQMYQPINAHCQSNPPHPSPLYAFWLVTTKGWMHEEFRLKACHYKSCACVLMCLCCDSQPCFIQPPTLCTCHLQLRPPSMLTSEEAGYTPTCPAGCDQLDKQPCPNLQLLWSAATVQDPRLIVRPHGGQAVSDMWAPASFRPVSLCSSHRASSLSYPSVLQLLSHMHSGQGSAAFVVALTDGNRNSSANRPIVWFAGDR